jgi:hypothetical protein
LEDWYLAVDELLPRLGADWRPNFQCNDLGQFHDKGQFASLQLRLRSSTRLLVVAFAGRQG